MRCLDPTLDVGAALDGELGVVRAWRVRRHLGTCPRCRAASNALRAGRDARRTELPRHVAPPALVARLAGRFGGADGGAPRAFDAQRRRWLLAGAAGGCVATVAATFALRALPPRAPAADVALAEAAVAAHVRATLGDALVAVASDDRHTVKPWLSARLDYAPPVVARVPHPDPVPADGAGVDAPCELVGARLDELDGRRVAVLVYRYRAHVVDVFVWPERPDGGDAATTIRGFNVRQTHGHEMRWVAVSDVNTVVLDALLAALRG